MKNRASIHIGGRTYSEVVDLDEIREHYDECEFTNGKTSWKYYTRPVMVEGWSGLEKLAGNHLLLGWVESISQSDRSPMFCLEWGQDKKKGSEIRFEFS